MKYILAFIAAVILMLWKSARVVLAWTGLDPATAVFSVTNMEPDYGDGGSEQFMTKLVRNTGYNFNYCTNILPHRRIFINAQSFTSGQELTFDTDHNWTGAGVGIIVNPDATYWSGSQYSSRCSRTLVLSSSYQEIYLYDDNGATKDFDIKYIGTAGFRIKNNIAATRLLSCIIIRGNIHVGA